MGVYPGRGPALISRADMIILPPTTPSATTNFFLLEPDEGVACPEVMLKVLHRTLMLRVASCQVSPSQEMLLRRQRRVEHQSRQTSTYPPLQTLVGPPCAALLLSLIA